MTKNLLLALLLSGCGAPFTPAYPGEPECGSATSLHGVIGEPCSEVMVACDCEDRRTLECVDGVWVFSRWLCHGGLGVSAE